MTLKVLKSDILISEALHRGILEFSWDRGFLRGMGPLEILGNVVPSLSSEG